MVLRILGRIFIDTIVVLGVLALILIFFPGISPHGTYEYHALSPELERTGAFAPNQKLNKAVRLFENVFNGPESIASRGKDGELFVSMHGGSIVQVYQDYKKFRPVVKIGPGCEGQWDEETCGRPLGLRFSRDGKLLVADSYLGVFSVDVDKREKQLLVDPSEPVNGATPKIIDDVDEDSEGNIFWSDASSLSGLDEGMVELLAGPSGRLVRRDAKTGQNLVVVDNLHFANGVQLSPTEDFVLVCETLRRRVMRYWLKGPKVGTTDVFTSGLPGFPDNIRAKPTGGYYVSLVSVVDPDAPDILGLLLKMPWLRRLTARALQGSKNLLELLHSVYEHQALKVMAYKVLNLATIAAHVPGSHRTMVVSVDAKGRLDGCLEGDNGAVGAISEVHQIGNKLFFGSPYKPYLGMLDLSQEKPEVKKQTQSKKKEKKEEL